MVSNERIGEIIAYSITHGDAETCEVYNINIETLSRYKRKNKRLSYLSEINKKYDDNTLKKIANDIPEKIKNKKVINFNGEIYDFALCGDTHIGSTNFREDVWEALCKKCNDLKIKILFHTGDLTEGMYNNRLGSIYELSCIGYNAQRAETIKQFNKFKGEIYFIDGNHDLTHFKNSGAIIGEDIAKENKDWYYLGQCEGDLILNGINIRLWHGIDSGGSYALSYRPQKIIESFTGGKKPNILFIGHSHKFIYMFERNIYCVDAGCVQDQTSYMRGKRLAAHLGFSIGRMVISNKEVKSLTLTWYPIYR